jgi:hypothetical protein
VKTNHEMDILYEEVREENLDDPTTLPQKLLTLVNGGFVEEDECVFLALLKKAAPVTRLDFPDRTKYECFVNHIHIEDYLENGGLPPLQMLGRGLAMARELKAQLLRLEGNKHFRIIVAFQGPSCTVRFHTIRLDEEWVDKDAGRYGPGAIAVMDTRELEI